MVVKPFSCSGKKRAKRSRPKGRYGQMRPLRYPPPHRQNFNAKSKGIMPLTYYVFALAFGEFVKTTAILVQVSPIFPAVRREGYIGEVLQSAANRNRSIASGNRSLIYAFVRSAFLLRCPIKSSHHGGCLILSTAATRSVRFYCHRQRSLRSPMPLSLVTFLCGHKKVTPSSF